MTSPASEASSAPEVSVVTPIKGRWELLRETMDSVNAQTLERWEHVLVDDGSDAETLAQVESRAKADPRVRLIVRRTDPPGGNACRNLGWQAARAPLIVFLDSDDLLAKEALASRVEFMRRNPDLDFAVFDADVFRFTVGDLGREFDMGVGDDLDRFLAIDLPWETTCPIWRKSALARLGGWDETLASWQDVDLHIRALASPLRYSRSRVVDHHIRWVTRPERISRRKGFEPELVLNCAPCAAVWHDALARGKRLSPSRIRALAGVYFHLSEQLAGLRQLRAAQRLWFRARNLDTPAVVVATGAAMLTAMRLRAGESRLFRGLLRRWKVRAGLTPSRV